MADESKTVSVAVEDVNGDSVTYTVAVDEQGDPAVGVSAGGVLAVGYGGFYAPGTWKRAYSVGTVVAEAPEA